MKRLIVTSMLTAAGMFAQSAGSAQTPADPNSKTTQPTSKKKHRKAKKNADKSQTSSQPSAPAKQ